MDEIVVDDLMGDGGWLSVMCVSVSDGVTRPVYVQVDGL